MNAYAVAMCMMIAGAATLVPAMINNLRTKHANR